MINAAAKVGGIHANNTQRMDFVLENLKINMNILEACVDNNNIAIINLGDLQKLIDNKKINSNEKINIDNLKKSKILRKSISQIKILSNGEFKCKIDIEADYSSKAAKEKIEKVGGQITLKNQSK